MVIPALGKIEEQMGINLNYLARYPTPFPHLFVGLAGAQQCLYQRLPWPVGRVAVGPLARRG